MYAVAQTFSSLLKEESLHQKNKNKHNINHIKLDKKTRSTPLKESRIEEFVFL